MATTTRITCTGSKYGNTINNSYTNNGNVYIARNPDTGTYYRTRLNFPSIRSLASIGDANIIITKVTLHLYRNDGGPATVVAGSSASSAWGTATDGSGSGTVGASTGWYTIDITNCADAILYYPGTWFIHLTGSGTRVRCNGTSPYINVVWEYTANTISTNVESLMLGDTVSLHIDKQEGDSTFSLDYEFGSERGTIIETSDTTVYWPVPIEFASEIPNDDSGEIKITMIVYDVNGKRLRMEVLYLTVIVPESMMLKFQDNTFDIYYRNGLSYGVGNMVLLSEKSHIAILPIIDLNETYGASIASLTAEIDNVGYIQNISWTNLEEEEPGIFVGDPLECRKFINAGTTRIRLTAEDSRGRKVSVERSCMVYGYTDPIISNFSISRYEPVYDQNEEISSYVESDIGENVWVTFSATCSNVVVNNESINFINWVITAKSQDGVETTYSGGGDSTVIDFNEDRTIITTRLPASQSADYTVGVVDTAGYSAWQYDSVAPGRANFALAASKYGASFGCLPKGTEYHPMLESAYPFYAYGGIEGVTNYVEGEVNTGGTWIDGKPIYRRIYTKDISGSLVWISLGENPADVGTVTRITGVMYTPPPKLSYRTIPCVTTGDNSAWAVMVVMESGTVNVRLGSGYTGQYSAIVIVEYTKATDMQSHQAFVDAAGNYLVTADGYQYMTKNMEVR